MAMSDNVAIALITAVTTAVTTVVPLVLAVIVNRRKLEQTVKNENALTRQACRVSADDAPRPTPAAHPQPRT